MLNLLKSWRYKRETKEAVVIGSHLMASLNERLEYWRLNILGARVEITAATFEERLSGLERSVNEPSMTLSELFSIEKAALLNHWHPAEMAEEAIRYIDEALLEFVDDIGGRTKLNNVILQKIDEGTGTLLRQLDKAIADELQKRERT